MQFDTMIAVVIRSDFEAWQKLNVASFLAGGIASAFSAMHWRALFGRFRQAARGGDSANIDKQLCAGLIEFVEHSFRRRLLIADGEEFSVPGHSG